MQIKASSAAARTLMIAILVAYGILTWFFVRWDFAHAISPGIDTVELADLAVEMSPADPQTHYVAAVLRDRTLDPGDAERALSEYTLAVTLAPYNYQYWVALARARERAGDHIGAERSIETALELAPHNSAVHWSYGNIALRSGDTAAGMSGMARAAAADPKYLGPAVITAMQIFDGDADTTIGALGNGSAVRAETSLYLARAGNFDEAARTWELISGSERRTAFREKGLDLQNRFLGAKKFRYAAAVSNDVRDDHSAIVGSVSNGGFESAVRFKDASIFDWQIGEGGVPQVGLSEARKHGGSHSLFLIFETMLAADFRQISQTVAVGPGTGYSLTFFAWSELQGGIALEIADASDGHVIARAPVTTSNDWVRYEANFVTGAESDGIIMRLVRDGCITTVCPISGKLWIDDVAITRSN